MDMSWLWYYVPEIFAIVMVSGVVVTLTITGMFIADMLEMLWKS